jgi:hypothetical protein
VRVKLLVTDAVSVAPRDNETEIHRILLGGGVAVRENRTSRRPDGII